MKILRENFDNLFEEMNESAAMDTILNKVRGLFGKDYQVSDSTIEKIGIKSGYDLFDKMSKDYTLTGISRVSDYRYGGGISSSEIEATFRYCGRVISTMPGSDTIRVTIECDNGRRFTIHGRAYGAIHKSSGGWDEYSSDSLRGCVYEVEGIKFFSTSTATPMSDLLRLMGTIGSYIADVYDRQNRGKKLN